MSLAAGKFDRRVRIERATMVTDPGSGADVPTWDTLIEVWGGRLQQHAVEAWRAGGSAASLETAWMVRWSSATASLTSKDRFYEISGGNRVGPIFSITGDPVEVGRREGVQMIGVAETDAS